MEPRKKQDPTGKGGRPVTGSVVWADAANAKPVGVRVMQANGKRVLVTFDPGTTRDDSIALAPVLAERARNTVEEGTGETLIEYAGRWLADRSSRGIGSARAHDLWRL